MINKDEMKELVDKIIEKQKEKGGVHWGRKWSEQGEVYVKKKKKKKRRLKYNRFFKNVDSTTKAYWLGYIYADGCITGGKKFTIGAKLSDRAHIENLRVALGSRNIVGVYKTGGKFRPDNYYVQFSVREIKIVEDLMKWGVIPRKSVNTIHMPSLRSDLNHHFIRGYNDGDGCIEKRGYSIQIAGQEMFLTEMLSVLERDIDANRYHLYKRKDTCVLTVSNQRGVLELLKYMYEDSSVETRLERKWKIAKEVITLIERRVKKVQLSS